MKLNQRGGVAAIALVTGSLLWASTTPASAVVLTPPAGPTAPDTFDATLPTGAGSVVADTGTVSLTSTNGAFTSTYDEQVVKTAAGTLDFVLVTTNNGRDDIGRVTLGSFAGFTTDVGWATVAGTLTGGSVIPSTVDRQTADVVGFNFTTFAANTTTEVLVVETNATAFTGGNVNQENNGVASGTGFAPAPAPLIGHGLLVLLAIGGVLSGGKLLEDLKKRHLHAA